MKKIYFITDGDVYKIGVSEHPKERLKQLQTANPNELWVAFEFPTEFGQQHETTLHRFLNRYHKRGEWFVLEKSEFENAKKICQQIEDNFKILRENSTLYL